MNQVYALGVDPAKQKATLCLLDHEGNVVLKPFDAPASKEGFEQILAALSEVLEEGDHLLAGVEATAALDDNWLAFFSTLEEPYGVTVLRLDAAQVKRFGSARPLRSKTDRADARQIAEFLRVYADRLDAFLHDPEANSMLVVVNDRMALVKHLTQHKNILRDRLVLAFPEFEKVFNDTACPQALAVLEAAPTAAQLARKHLATIAGLRAPKRRSRRVGEERARQLLALAKDSIASHRGGLISESIRRLVERIRLLKRQLDEVDETIRVYAETIIEQAGGGAEESEPAAEGEASLPEQIRLADSLPGVGLTTAATVVLRSRGITRFVDEKAFAAQLAVSPDRLQTGSSRDIAHLGRRGDRRTRPLYYLAVRSATQTDLAFAFYKWHYIQAGQTPHQAICSCMNRHARLLYTIVKNRTPYDPQRTIQNIQIHHPHQWQEFLKYHEQEERKATKKKEEDKIKKTQKKPQEALT